MSRGMWLSPSGLARAMRVYKEGAELRSAYMPLWRRYKKGFGGFASFDKVVQKIVDGRFLVLRRFEQKLVGVLRDGKPVLLAVLFQPDKSWPSEFPASLGCFAADPSLTADESAFFWREIGARYSGRKLVAPMNGHHYLGFATAPADADPFRIGFQTSMTHSQRSTLFNLPEYRGYWSLETQLTPERVRGLKDSVADIPAGLRVRCWDKSNARLDFDQLNQLVNVAFVDHFDFAPLSDEENWDIFKDARPLLRPEHLLFLYDGGKPVAFAFGMFDYNQVLRSGGDLMNIARLVFTRRPERARLIHIGIHPEYRGQKLIKFMRNRMLLAFAEQGVQIVESSYVDEGNINSLANVRSTGGSLIHRFSLQIMA